MAQSVTPDVTMTSLIMYDLINYAWHFKYFWGFLRPSPDGEGPHDPKRDTRRDDDLIKYA